MNIITEPRYHMKYLNIQNTELKAKGAFETAREIEGQPDLWSKIFEKLASENDAITKFLDMTLSKVRKILLTGAGTSAYIGCSVEGAMQRNTGITTLSVPTTHLVSHPQDYFEYATPMLLVSFARSGNSPESVAAVKLADKHCKKCFHLIITCNEDGDLANYDQNNNVHVFLLPPDSNDKSLAMTGSYSGMLLSALLMSDYKNISNLGPTVNTLSKYGKEILSEKLNQIQDIGQLPFKRAVFLGSGPQYGTAMESSLKLQELSDGAIVCKNDSYLGFRHGPKAVVDEETLVVYYFSNVESVLRYEIDLVNGMVEGKKPLRGVGISVKTIDSANIDELILLDTASKLVEIEEQYLPVVMVMLGQLIGFYKSLSLGLEPDSPSTTGAISRVVKGVNIY